MSRRLPCKLCGLALLITITTMARPSYGIVDAQASIELEPFDYITQYMPRKSYVVQERYVGVLLPRDEFGRKMRPDFVAAARELMSYYGVPTLLIRSEGDSAAIADSLGATPYIIHVAFWPYKAWLSREDGWAATLSRPRRSPVMRGPVSEPPEPARGSTIWLRHGVRYLPACSETSGDSTKNCVRMRVVAEHELGHALGLVHYRNPTPLGWGPYHLTSAVVKYLASTTENAVMRGGEAPATQRGSRLGECPPQLGSLDCLQLSTLYGRPGHIGLCLQTDADREELYVWWPPGFRGEKELSIFWSSPGTKSKLLWPTSGSSGPTSEWHRTCGGFLRIQRNPGGKFTLVHNGKTRLELGLHGKDRRWAVLPSSEFDGIGPK